jgi:CO/xanthine dehydrogenase FAD-binding subunit
MPNRLREYQRPADLAAALNLLRRTDVLSAPVLVGLRPPVDPYGEAEIAVDLSALKLNYIDDAHDAIHIGGLTPLQDIADSPLLRGLADGILAQAIYLAARLNLRHIATLGGALALPEGPVEIRLVLGALGAQVVVQGLERLELPVRDWEGSLHGQIVSEVKIPRASVRRNGGLARVARAPLDAAIIAAAAVVESEAGAIRQAHIQVGPSPRCDETVATRSEEGLTPSGLIQSALEHLDRDRNLLSDYRGSAGYRREMAGVLVKRALTQALKGMTAERHQ